MVDQPAAGTTPPAAAPSPATNIRVSPPFKALWVRDCAAKTKCLLGGTIVPKHDGGPGVGEIQGEEAVFVSRTDKHDANGKEARVVMHKVCAIARGLKVPEPIQTSIDDFLA